ncbi:MAG TPA: thioesterase family protein [Gemmatimonadaceae bacterium]|nr:thioesterase family protein [Gemmatimonadaceae bacterium]
MRFPLAQRYSDYDAKQHVNNAVYLTYFEMARARAWLDALGGTSANLPFIVAEATVRYVSEARLGDPLDIAIWTDGVRTKSWVWRYRMYDSRDDRLVAEGNTVQVMYDYEGRRTIAIPEELRERLAAMREPDARDR